MLRNRLARPQGMLDYSTLEQRNLLAADVAPLVDVYADSLGGSSSPLEMVESGGVLFFTASTPTTGRELWKTDGTEAGTQLVRDIRVGSQASSPANLTDVDGTLFFQANDGAGGAELWKSDGTTAGTVLVKDVRPGSLSSSPSQLVVIDGQLVFAAYTDSRRLWTSDGTAEGTIPIDNLGVSFNYLTVVGDRAFFADSNGGRRALWSTDGTVGGKQVVKDIDPGNLLTNHFVDVDGTLFFVGNDQDHGRELWKSDGTEAGTLLVKNIVGGDNSANPRELTAVGSTLFFTVADGDLWKSDGTESGTVEVEGFSGRPTELTASDGGLVFRGNRSSSAGSEIWISDGTETGTVRLRNLETSSWSIPENFTASAGAVYFHAKNRNQGYGLWKTDGTSAGTVRVKDIAPNGQTDVPTELYDWNGTLLFPANDLTNGIELWKSDGTEAGTLLIKDVDTGAADSNPNAFAFLGSDLVFAADAADGRTLWKWSQIDGATIPLPATFDGFARTSPREFVSVDGTVFFTRDDRRFGIQLWKTDGTVGGTQLVKDITIGSERLASVELTEVDGTLFFKIAGSGLWTSDGTEAGTTLLREFDAVGELLNYGGTLFFIARDSQLDVQLWTSDGTEAGTVLVKDLAPEGGSSFPTSLVEAGGLLYFSSGDRFSAQLWKSDGTAEGTQLLTQAGRSHQKHVSAGGRLFFNLTTINARQELWTSDGTVAGTQRVKAGFRFGTQPAELADSNGILYFSADDGVHGMELWKSDGTEAGTVMVRDIRAGIASSEPTDLLNVNGVLYFQANDGIGGEELWHVDGDDVKQVLDIAADSSGSTPGSLASNGQTLFFAATTDSFGRELYAINFPTSLTLSATTVRETSLLGSSIGVFETFDLDTHDAHTYSLVNGEGAADNAAFEIVGDALFSIAAIDFETKPSYSLRVRATDPLGFYHESVIVVSVADVPELVEVIAGDGEQGLPSFVDQISVQFDGAVELGAGALELVSLGEVGGAVSLSIDVVASEPPQGEIGLSFSGQFAEGSLGNLLPGYYQLAVDRSKVTRDGVTAGLDADQGSVDVSTVYVALPGDANLDGVVDVLTDTAALINDLGLSSGATWARGDFNGDGAVDVLADAAALINNLGRDVRLPVAGATASSQSVLSASVASDSADGDVASSSSIGLPQVALLPNLVRDGDSSNAYWMPLRAVDQAAKPAIDDEAVLQLAGSYESLDAAFEILD